LDTENFWQIHRSAIVQATAIKSVQRGEEGRLTLRVQGKEELLPVSSAFHYRFKGM
jgi:DNA-binding LytR/AlgR family response regulator